MQVKRPPDHIGNFGSKFWFKELMYWSNTTGYRNIFADSEGFLCMHTGKKGRFRKGIQDLFRQWAIKEAEEIMVDGQEKT